MADNGELTAKQQMFCKEYLLDLNATQAAIRAGYSPKTAKVQGCQNLTKLNIQKEIQRLKAERSNRLEIKADNVVKELAKLAFSNIKSFLDLENDEVYFKNLSDVPDELTAALESIKVMKKTIKGKKDKDGDGDVEVQTIQFKLHNKPNTLDQLCRHLGLFKADSIPAEQPSEPVPEDERQDYRAAADLVMRRQEERRKAKERRKAEELQPPDTTKNAFDTARTTEELSAKVEGTPAWELEQTAQEIEANSEQTVGEKRQAERLAKLDKQRLTENEDEPEP